MSVTNDIRWRCEACGHHHLGRFVVCQKCGSRETPLQPVDSAGKVQQHLLTDAPRYNVTRKG